jgi:hypothetical protein
MIAVKEFEEKRAKLFLLIHGRDTVES